MNESLPVVAGRPYALPMRLVALVALALSMLGCRLASTECAFQGGEPAVVPSVAPPTALPPNQAAPTTQALPSKPRKASDPWQLAKPDSDECPGGVCRIPGR